MCPGRSTVNLTCSHDSTVDLTRWDIGAPSGCFTIAVHSTNPSDTLYGTYSAF